MGVGISIGGALQLVQYRGELAALGGAVLWAIASTVYARAGRTLAPLVLNLTKGLVALGFMLVTLLIQRAPLPVLDLGQWALLLGSGIIGIGIGDTVFFAALNRIGARRTVLIEALSPPFATLLAIFFLGELLGGLAYGGIGLTVLGVTWVVLEKMPRRPAPSSIDPSTDPQPPHSSLKHARLGVIYGLMATLCQATGAVMTRAALADTAIPPLWSGLVRLAAGTLVVGLLLAIQRPGKVALAPLRSPSFLGLIATTAFGSTFLAIWLQQTALKYAEAGVAQALLSTSPLFVIPFAMMTGERVSLRAFLGVMLALAGIWLLFYPGS